MARVPVPYAPAGVVARAMDFLSGAAGQSGAAEENPFATQSISDEEARQAIIRQAAESNDPAEQERLGRALFALSGTPRAPENQRDAEGQMLAQIWRSQMGPPGLGTDAASFLQYQQNVGALLNPDPISADGAVVQATGATSDFGDSLDKLEKQGARQAVMDLANVNKTLSDPSLSDQQRADLVQQWQAKYPQFAEQMRPRPMSKEQAAAMMRQVRLQEANSTALALLRGEEPGQLVFENEKGELEVPPGIGEALRIRSQERMIERQMEADRQRSERERLKIEMNLLELEKPQELDRLAALDPAQKAQYDAQMRAWAAKKRALLQQQTGQPMPTTPAPPAPASQPVAPPDYPTFGSTADVKAAVTRGDLRPGQRFMVNGVVAEIDENGFPRVVAK